MNKLFNVYCFNGGQLIHNHESVIYDPFMGTTTTLSPAPLERIFMINSRCHFRSEKQMKMAVIEVARTKLI